ncbi:alpha/beta hydrolase family protein [Simiduia aestuariiviva]|uniref:Dipeptidyl aminopeptidase/acylaminoacyl peptidase n=1 Tax=Simiduia aestuariiviva TaxID=1510459 RepID=A0A839UMZ8_9GAMM|nr:S9 family peptidase [Simiduia aestuariiviva]MBB3167929.1 dipeptidyl aminopeptidase/acylaminoacyl peptidase [Simiduia aestuariiviva]
MTSMQSLPYGSWPSPIQASLLTQGGVRLALPYIDQEASWWLESRPAEQGRTVLVRQPFGGSAQDITPPGVSVRSKVNEYGGGDYTVSGAQVFFVNGDDQQIYQQTLSQTHQASNPRTTAANATNPPTQLTFAEHSRFADVCFDAQRNRLIAVQERHNGTDEPEHRLVAIDLVDGQIHSLATGADFYASPALSPCGNKLAWLSWNHPNMPWDQTDLSLATLDAQGATESTRIISPTGCSCFQPLWSPAGELIVAHDASGWWNLYQFTDPDWRALLPMAAEFATPQWVFGMSCFGFLDDSRLFATYNQQGQWHCGILVLGQAASEWNPIATPLTDMADVACAQGQVILLGASASEASAVWRFDQHQWHCERASVSNPIGTEFISKPRAVCFPTTQSDNAHGLYYAPTHPHCTGPESERPPLIVLSHGGPTAATSSALNFKIQYWTSRGFAVLDVNYRGSTGYGRTYRDRLRGHWGIYDVDDVCAGAQYLVDQGLADPERLIIKGSSAGGYTVLAALTFRDLFCAGTSLYGIGDLTALATDTHKFESRYLDSLIAPWPEGEATYRARSPLFHVQRLTCPVAFFQGLEDKVVPPNQAEAMVAALAEKGVKTAHITFASEGHGFRQAQSIVDQLELELNFYGALFGFDVQPKRADFSFVD